MYEFYMKAALEFMDFAYTPLKEREQREKEKQLQQAEIVAELSKIQRTIGLLSNKIPNQMILPENQIYSAPPENENNQVPEINDMLKKQSEHLESIKKLLSSI